MNCRLMLKKKRRLDRKYGIKIPGHVDTFRYLDLSPQESLPVRLRNIGKQGEIWRETDLYLLTATYSKSKKAELIRRQTLEELFFYVFGLNRQETDQFNSILSGSRANTIILVEGHSMNAPWEIGEKYPYEPEDNKIKRLQRRGNKIPVKEILKKYNDPDKYAAILFYACNRGIRKIKALDVPLAYALGIVGFGKSKRGLLPTMIVTPGKTAP